MLDIDRQRCNGCGDARISLCEDICPGNLLLRDNTNRITIRDASTCWDCCACVKQCPRDALSIALPFAISTSRCRLLARKVDGRITWHILGPDGAIMRHLETKAE